MKLAFWNGTISARMKLHLNVYVRTVPSRRAETGPDWMTWVLPLHLGPLFGLNVQTLSSSTHMERGTPTRCFNFPDFLLISTHNSPQLRTRADFEQRVGGHCGQRVAESEVSRWLEATQAATAFCYRYYYGCYCKPPLYPASINKGNM